MALRDNPYGAFNFEVRLANRGGDDGIVGGFSDFSGAGNEVKYSEYRNGNDPENHVRKVPGVHKVSDVTLKRGIVSSADLWAWIEDVRRKGVAAQRTVAITLRDEASQSVQTWTLRGVIPLKYTGPTLAAKGGGDVAMEELVLSAESLVLGD
jgi:phage tail-like protein